MSGDIFDSLLSGSNSTKELTKRNGDSFLVRSGTRSERNRISKLLNNSDLMMDGIALTLFLRVAKEDGSRYFEDSYGNDFKKFAEDLNYDDATEMAVLIAKLDEPKKDDYTLDQKTEKALKNSKRQKGVS